MVKIISCAFDKSGHKLTKIFEKNFCRFLGIPDSFGKTFFNSFYEARLLHVGNHQPVLGAGHSDIDKRDNRND